MPQPQNPAPVSGPGALSRRTDGGPGNAAQPISAAPGQPFGDRGAQEAQQQAARMAGQPQRPDVFGPSTAPDEPITAGVGIGPGPGPRQPSLPPDPDMMLRAIYSMYPHPDLERLLKRRG